jgi:hypothetical protein
MTQALEQEGDGALAQSNVIRITLKLFALLSGYLPDGATHKSGRAFGARKLDTDVDNVLASLADSIMRSGGH